ncbi:MAG TPA: hypothetical protein ENN68_02130 [Methanomicrobia archaeon]|nr:hypothetical protein [Methanomicrobia archaeon]
MKDIVVQKSLRCSVIRDTVTTKDGGVTEERTVRLENDIFAITLRGQPDKLPFTEGEEYSAEFRTPQMQLPFLDETTAESVQPADANGTDGDMESGE